MTTPAPADVAALVTRLAAGLDEVGLRDRHTLRRRLEALRAPRRADQPERHAAALERVARDLAAAQERMVRRRAAVPAVSYPPELPVSQAVEELRAVLRERQVVVVAGATGSGKTTQLPKILLELGRGVRGLIGHTQPRRIAARTVAERIAEELGVTVGEQVGYAVRFTDHVGPQTLVKIMTDGILLAEVQSDRDLLAYDTIIIDEAHERSLNVDFLLGYLRELLPRRPDLKVVITSATIDPARFADHFATPGRPVPVVEVSGRTYPVEVRYRPLSDPDDPATLDRDQTQAVVDAVAELGAEGPGDVLVFLSGEREIRDTADALRGAALAGTEILPLYARLSAAEQHRVFEPRPGGVRRRVVLATNVAETSLTVPGIRYVVDPGTARISRWSRRTRVQRLPIEAISQASAAQRAGRCGRVSDGVAVRLYTEEDLLSRPAFTDPEILRTDLAAIVLRMTALGLGDVGAFPFLDPPDRRDIRDAEALLHELGAVERAERGIRLTPLGRRLARLPIDPRLGRMLLESDRLSCLREVLVIVAALAIQDPRERPADAQQQAAQAHARFADDTSDFLAFGNLWTYLREQQQALSSSAFRRMCKAEYLHHLRVREWQDLHGQLRSIVGDLGLTVSSAPDPHLVHQALAAGLLSHVGLRDERAKDYQGARGARFSLVRDSALARKQPQWVVAAELVETNRLWARTAARVEPEWIEALAPHLVLRTYSEPRWDRRRGSVVATERVTLYGLPLVTARRVSYGTIDPALSRELFIQHALVEDDWDTHHAFAAANRELLAEIEALGQRTRRRDLRISDARLYDFYDARVPADVVSARHFDVWWKSARRELPDLLTLDRAELLAGDPDVADFPERWSSGEVDLPLSYAFDPGSARDGLTVHVPLPVLNQLTPQEFSWQVPGLREELLTALLRGLPKGYRRRLGPAPDLARDLLVRIDPGQGPLLDVLGHELLRTTGVDVPAAEWERVELPPHLRPTFAVTDEHGAELAASRDLPALHARLAPRVRTTLARAADGVERAGLRGWEPDLPPVPRTVERTVAGHAVVGYPALVDEGESVAVRVLPSAAEQERAMARGTRRLLRLSLPSPLKAVRARLDPRRALALGAAPHASLAALLEDCVAAALDGLVAAHGGPAWDAAGFGRLRDTVRAELESAVVDVVATVGVALEAARDLDRALAGLTSPAAAGGVADVRRQVAALLPDGFVARTGRDRLPDLARYLRAAQRRVERLPQDAARDAILQQRVEGAREEWQRAVDRMPRGAALPAALVDVRWLLEELRVSLWAQSLGTRGPVSEQRISRAIDAALP